MTEYGGTIRNPPRVRPTVSAVLRSAMPESVPVQHMYSATRVTA